MSDVSPPGAGAYPPRQYLETDPGTLHALMERFSFATLVSARGVEDPIVTHLPLVLDRTRGEHGVLVGHMDRANPHVQVVADRLLTVLFHGPNSYISPLALDVEALPTWNSMNVHVRGRGRILPERSLPDALAGICEHADPDAGAYRLDPGDPRIRQLIGRIVGLEIEIHEMVGRFKLSQEHDDRNRARAASVLSATAERGERELIEQVVGLAVAPGDRGPSRPGGGG